MTDPRRHPYAGVPYLLAAVASWGAYFPLAKLILLKLSPVGFLIIRLGVGALTLLALNLRPRRSLAIQRRDWPVVIAAGLVGIVLHQMIQLNGLRQTSATNTGWILTLIPPVTGILGWFFLRERVSPRQILGLVIAMIGVVFFVANGRPQNLSLGHNTGDFLALGSIVTWSSYTIMTKSRLGRCDALALSAIHMALGFVVFLAFGAVHLPGQAAALSPRDWLIVLAIGVIPSGLAYYWWNAGLQRASAINTSMFLFLEAIVASVAGFLLLGEPFTAAKLGSAIVIIGGVTIGQRQLGRKEPM
ncbi:MAG: DMT family transporter [candidate division Zixibacteria bacterium]|nr:DMT family transporter [candidate division Zixibacteria bacterium]